MPQPPSYPYATHLDVRFAALERIDVQDLVDACSPRALDHPHG